MSCGILDLSQWKNCKEIPAELFQLDHSEQIFLIRDDDALLLKYAAEQRGSSDSIGAIPRSGMEEMRLLSQW